MSERNDSARREIETLIAEFKECADQAEHISKKMAELAKKIAQQQSLANKSSHEIDTMPAPPESHQHR